MALCEERGMGMNHDIYDQAVAELAPHFALPDAALRGASVGPLDQRLSPGQTEIRNPPESRKWAGTLSLMPTARRNESVVGRLRCGSIGKADEGLALSRRWAVERVHARRLSWRSDSCSSTRT